MPVMAIFDVAGDPDQLAERYERALPRIAAAATEAPLSHTCARTETGLRIVDVWSSQQTLEDFTGSPGFQAAIQEAGLPAPTVQVHPVQRHGW